MSKPKLSGDDNIDNLALACRRCNERRYNFVAGFDETLPLPRSESIGE